MRRILAAAMTIALAAVGAAATGARADQVHSGGYDPQIKWGTCTDPSLLSRKAECGVLAVPVDYSKPDGPTLDLAVARIKHTVPDAKYQGVMLVNPGGPGAKGQSL